MATICGIVACFFDGASDLLPSTRDNVPIDGATAPVSVILQRLFQRRNVAPDVVQRHDVTVVPCDAQGQRAPTSDGVADALAPSHQVANYSNLWVSARRIPDAVLARRAAEERERAAAEVLWRAAAAGTSGHAAGAAGGVLPEPGAVTAAEGRQAARLERRRAFVERAAKLCALRLPVGRSVVSIPGASEPITTAPPPAGAMCRLCASAPVPQAAQAPRAGRAATLPAPCDRRCRGQWACAACYDYCQVLCQGGRACPVCGVALAKAPGSSGPSGLSHGGLDAAGAGDSGVLPPPSAAGGITGAGTDQLAGARRQRYNAAADGGDGSDLEIVEGR